MSAPQSTPRFEIGLTLEVEASTEQDALTLAYNAGLAMRGEEGVQHCLIDHQAVPLFASEPFAQYGGQVSMDTDES